MKRRMSKLLAGIMFVNAFSVYASPIIENNFNYPDAMETSIDITTGGAIELNQTTSAAISMLPLDILFKEIWTEGKDGKWRKLMTPEQLEFNHFNEGIYQPIPEGSNVPKSKADYKPSIKPINEFYDDGPGAEGSFTIIKFDEADNENKALKFVPSVGAANNLMYKARIDQAYQYEVRFRYKTKNGNATLRAQKNGIDIPGAWVDENDNPVILKDGTISSKPEYNLAAKDGSWNASIETWHEGKLLFKGNDVAGGIIDFKIWKAGNAEVVIDYIDLVAVSPNNPDMLSPKQQLMVTNDLILTKNAGNFENWNGQRIPVQKTDGKSFYTNGIVEITNEEAKNENGNAAKISTGSELVLEVDKLRPDTEYSIFFSAKPNVGGRVEFRMSGFKDNTKFDYDNGNYTDNGEWENSDIGRANMFNWLENLKINDSKNWNDFRYDFTTGRNTENSIRARFKAVGANALVDQVYLVEREALKELTNNNKLPGNQELSRGNRILIDEGLQYQSWITTDAWEQEKGWIKQPPLDAILDMGLTAVQYNDKPNFDISLHEEADRRGISLKWSTAWGPKYSHLSTDKQDGSDGKVGQPTEEEWLNGYLTPLTGLNYVNDLVSMCIGDEEDYSDTLTQNIKSWFELIRENYETEDKKILLHHNEVGNTVADNMVTISTFNKDMLRKYIRTAKPDMITYDMYYFRERRIEQTQGGSVIPFYDDLNRYRIVSNEGLDGTGNQPIPFGQYHYAWRTGPGAATPLKRGDGWYELTESQINLYSFATWAFGGKWMSNFRWLDNNPSYLFSDYRVNADGTYNKYHVYDQFKEMIRQSKNLGPHLVRIQNEDVAIVRGQYLAKTGEIETNNKPKDNPDWSSTNPLNQKVFIKDIEVQNLGEQNNGLNGDVFISYFKPLVGLTEEDKQVFTSTDPRYFMLLNGLTAGDGLPAEMQQGSSYETRQQIKVTFELPDSNYENKLRRVSRVDGGEMLEEQGKVVEVPLKHIGGNNYEMIITIGGGYADLFYWELGEEKATTTKWANETGKEAQLIGDAKYVNNIEKRDLEGRTLVIGHIKGTNDMAPEARLGSNINKPNEADLIDGKVIDLNNYVTPAGNIAGIGMRYFSKDIWNFRVNRIEADNNVNLEFKEFNWTKEELLENIKKIKAGESVEGMPDLLVVPNEWLWEKNNLVENEAIVPMDSFEVFDFTERKWNDAYKDMTSKDGKIYGGTIDLSMNPTGMFVSKTLLSKVGTSSVSNNGIYQLQKDDKWSFEELEAIMDTAIANNIVEEGYKLFVDNEHLMRQLLVSAGVDTNPLTFDANSQAFKEAMRLYTKLKDNNLLLEGTLEEVMAAFSQKKVIFLVAPYTEVAKHLVPAYWIYEDNTVTQEVDNFLNKWGKQTIIAPPQGENWKVKVKAQPAGKYEMPLNEWNFMLFPKATDNDNYRAILNGVSYPVMPSTTEDQDDIAFIWNELAQEYKGVDTLAELLKCGTEDYPVDRTFEPAIPANFNDQTARDLDTLRKVGLRDGYGDLLKASGVWDDVLVHMIYTDGNNGNSINEAVKSYLGIEEIDKPSLTNKKELEDAIKKALSKLKNDYTEESWLLFEKALITAQEVAANKDVLQVIIDEAKDALMTAMSNLQVKSTDKDDNSNQTENSPSDSSSNSYGNNPSNKPNKENNAESPKVVLPQLQKGNPEIIKDIEKHWAKEAIENVIKWGLMVGDENQNFRPEASLTRAEMASMIQRLVKGQTSNEKSINLKDIKGTEWYAEAIAVVNTLEMMAGYEDGTFRPKENISRQEVMVMITRLARYNKVDTRSDIRILDQYKDLKDISDWAKEDIAWCVEQEIIKGNDGKIEPSRAIKRSEIAVIFSRLFQ